MNYDWILEAGKIAGAVSAVGAVLYIFFKHFVVKPMKHFITHTVDDIVKAYTKPIQPNSNGGKSLPDVNKKVDNLDKRIDTLEENQRQMLEILTRPKQVGHPKKTEQ